MRGPAVEQMLVKLEHRESTLLQHMLLAWADGKQQQLTLAYEIGAEVTTTVNGNTARCLAHWQGSELVIESRIMVAGREMYFRDHWHLSADGRILTMEHRDDALAGQIAVLERAHEEATEFKPAPQIDPLP